MKYIFRESTLNSLSTITTMNLLFASLIHNVFKIQKRYHLEYAIFFQYPFPEYAMSPLSLLWIQYESPIFFVNLLWTNLFLRKQTIDPLCKLYLYCESTMGPISFSDFTRNSRFVLQIHDRYIIRDQANFFEKSL